MRNVLHHLAREPHAIGHDGTICLQMKSAPFRRFGDIRCICPVDLVSNLHAPVHQVLGNAETRVAVRLLRPSTEGRIHCSKRPRKSVSTSGAELE